jgi:hypothetical protein
MREMGTIIDMIMNHVPNAARPVNQGSSVKERSVVRKIVY